MRVSAAGGGADESVVGRLIELIDLGANDSDIVASEVGLVELTVPVEVSLAGSTVTPSKKSGTSKLLLYHDKYTVNVSFGPSA